MQPIRNTILVAGEIREYRGLGSDGREIFLADSKLVLFPVVRYGGSPLDPMPPFAPREIRKFSARVPDLTADHPDLVNRFFEQRRKYHSSLSYEEYSDRFPSAASEIDKDEFESARQSILDEPLEDFAKGDKARQEVWMKHGTTEEARKHGYDSRLTGSLLEQWIRHQRHSEEPAWDEVYKLRYVAIYPDAAKTRIYLSDLIEEPLPTMLGSVELDQRIKALETKHTRKMTRQTSNGGASTFSLREHPEAYAFLKRKLKEFYRRYGNAAKAIREALALFRIKYPSAPSISHGTARNILMGKTGQIMRKSCKRV